MDEEGGMASHTAEREGGGMRKGAKHRDRVERTARATWHSQKACMREEVGEA